MIANNWRWTMLFSALCSVNWNGGCYIMWILMDRLIDEACINPYWNSSWSKVERSMFYVLFLASTVSAMHRNAHIWNASHPLVVTYYCWVTVYLPSMKAKQKMSRVRRGESNNQHPSWATCPDHFASIAFLARGNFVFFCQLHTQV